jgi:hypothetical protein
MIPMKASLMIALIISVGALAAAGIGQPSSAGVPCPVGSGQAPSVGTGAAQGGDVRINGAKKRRARLSSGNVVCTDSVVFSLNIVVNRQQAACDIRPRGSLRIHPQPEIVLRFFFGTTTCWTGGHKKNGDPDKTFQGPDKTMIISEDPIFSVAVAKRQTVIRVIHGSVLVVGKSGTGSAVVLGPLQQSFVARRGDPTPATAFVPTSQERAYKSKFAAKQKPPDFSKPSSFGSPNLERVFGQGTLNVGFDDNTVVDSGTPTFVQSSFGFLAKSWNLRLNLTRGATLNELAKGKFDLVVSSSVGFGFDSLQLFEDSNKKIWTILINQDSTYDHALRHFVVSTVDGGQYDSMYRAAFARPPSYEPLREVLFPK